MLFQEFLRFIQHLNPFIRHCFFKEFFFFLLLRYPKIYFHQLTRKTHIIEIIFEEKRRSIIKTRKHERKTNFRYLLNKIDWKKKLANILVWDSSQKTLCFWGEYASDFLDDILCEQPQTKLVPWKWKYWDKDLPKIDR